MKLLVRLMAVLFLFAWLPGARAAYVVELAGLAQLGPQVFVAFDLVDGDGTSNVVTVSPLGSDGTLALLGLSGGATGSPATGLRLADDNFFSEALLTLDGADRLRFQFDFTAAATGPGGFPDSFSVFLLDPATLWPALATTDPTGSGALFRLDIDGTAKGGLALFEAAQAAMPQWSVSFVDGGTIPEPATWMLLLTSLALMAGRRAIQPFRAALALLLGLSLLGTAPARADDLTSSVQISRSGLVLNRLTNTFDASVTVRNTSAVPLLGPLQLALTSASPAHIALYNSHGRLSGGADYIVLPLTDGTLAPGASTTGVVRLITAGSAVKATQFMLDGQRLVPGQTAQLDVRAVFAAGYLGPQPAPVGPGFRVLVNGVARGITDAGGRLLVTVQAGPVEVAVQRPPNEGGSQPVPAVAAGSTVAVTVNIDDGKEIAADARLQLDAVQQGVLPRQASSIALRFVDAREQPVRLSVLHSVDLIDVSGNLTPLTSLFSLRPDGGVTATPAAFYQALAGKLGRLSLQVSGEDANGTVYTGTRDFHLADYRVRLQLAAPPSNPALPLAGIRLTATILNTDLRFQAESDANGLLVLPDLPRGNLSLSGSVTANGIVHVGQGTVPLSGNSLVTLTLRAPADVLANVPSISVKPLPAGMAAVSTGKESSLAASPVGASTQQAAVDPVRAARHAVAAARRLTPLGGAATAAAVPSASVSVSAAQQNAVMENSASLTVPKGTRKLTLRYVVSTAEYPYYVLQQSIYNDVWSLAVVSASAGQLFEQTRQINSQLSQEPAWLPNGTTGEIKKEIDISALTAQADVSVVLRATSVNIGDSLLTTSVNATLEATEPLLITNVAATAGEITSNNNGSYYSVPRPAATNTLQRTFTVDLSKPSGSTLTAVNVELLDSAGAPLMTVLQDAAPGASGVEVLQQDDTSAKLKVRITVSSPASIVAGTPPPTRDIGYRLRVKAADSQGSEISDEKTESGKRSLWRMPDGRARYGTRDAGGDDWVSRGGYGWIVANGTLLQEIDDVSGEHGRDIGHASHARGTDIDMYHFYRFPNATSGTDNYNRLAADVVAAFATLQPTPPAAATAAFGRVAAWLGATRQGLSNLAALASVSRLIYCSGLTTQGVPAGWCSALIQTGVVTRSVAGPNGSVTLTLNFGGTFANNKMSWRNDHNNHVHITLNPAQIAE
jgi:hypothetical protein